MDAIALWLCVFLSVFINQIDCQTQTGPDPWNYDKPPERPDEFNIPPDLRMPQKRKNVNENKVGVGEWFFKRTLAVILKGGHTQQNDDGTVDISLQMKFDPTQWEVLEECLKSENPLSEDMFRRTMGYVQDSIQQPSIAEKIILAWSDYIQDYLTEYKTYIIWTLGFLAATGALFWLWNHMSYKHNIIIIFIILYAYEVVVSYKEAEQKELHKFLSAIERCKWFFWKSTCEVPPPDPLIFLKHMDPSKIAVRMFSTILAEPFVAFSGTVETILHGITDGLWFPFDKIVHGILTVFINISMIFFFLMIIFNWLLNIPFNLGFGLFRISIKQRQRTLFPNNSNQEQTNDRREVQDVNNILSQTMNKVLDVCALALSNNAQNRVNVNPMLPSTSRRSRKVNKRIIHRSASTGRIPNRASSFESLPLALENVTRRKMFRPFDGSGDAR